MAYFDRYGVEFSNDKTILISCPEDLKGEYIIPDGVTNIGDYAFYDCNRLTSVIIPDSVTSIGDDAFAWCDALTAVHISDIVSWCMICYGGIESNPLIWAGTGNLYLNGELVTDLIIPESVKSIEDGVFEGCNSLTSITIPDSVTSIGFMAFAGCRNLTSVTIGNSVKHIDNYAFEGCDSLKEICVPKGQKARFKRMGLYANKLVERGDKE